LDLGRTAIEAQLDPGDVATVIGGEEHGGVRRVSSVFISSTLER
jgi:hypothetical protein